MVKTLNYFIRFSFLSYIPGISYPYLRNIPGTSQAFIFTILENCLVIFVILSIISELQIKVKGPIDLRHVVLGLDFLLSYLEVHWSSNLEELLLVGEDVYADHGSCTLCVDGTS